MKELASALAGDKYYATTVQNQLATKAPLASPTFTGAITTPKINVFNITTESGTTTSGVAIDGVQIRNGSNQSIMTVYGNTKATQFEGNLGCEGKVSALNFDNVDADGWIKTNSYLGANTIRAYNNGTMVTVDDNLTAGGNLTVSGNTHLPEQ